MSYKRLSLIKRFSILCFAALIIFGAALGWLVTRALERNMLKSAQSQTAAVVQQHIEENFDQSDFATPKRGEDYDAFARKAREIPVGTNIVKLVFWNTDDTVIWASDRKLVGSKFAGDRKETKAYVTALRGKMVAASFTDGPDIVNEYGEHRPAGGAGYLEMYVPITYYDCSDCFGAVEVYEDAGPLSADIASTKKVVWGGVGGGFALLFTVLFGLMSRASGKIERQSRELKDLVVGLTGSLATALDAKSPWTKGHSERVGMYSERIALKMGLPEVEIANLRLAGLLHDIGKIGTYDYLLDKPEGLTSEEFEHVKKHPEQGAQILSEIKQLSDILPVIEHHHERFDGQGYPKGLAGEEIPIGARILHVADSFEAITDDRPYRRARDYGAAIREIIRCSGSQFDPRVVQAFIDVMEELHGEAVNAKHFGTVEFRGGGSLFKNSLEDIPDVP